jgi:hypothetical protein
LPGSSGFFPQFPHLSQLRLKLGAVLAALIPLGLGSKAYQGSAADWLNNDFVGICYVVAWCLGVALLWPKLAAWKNALAVFLGTCIVEVLQLSEWYPITWARSFAVGRILLGTTFVWSDFLYYTFGAMTAFLLLRSLQKRHLPAS